MHVETVLRDFIQIADGMDDLLQAEFGGETAFTEAPSNATKH